MFPLYIHAQAHLSGSEHGLMNSPPQPCVFFDTGVFQKSLVSLFKRSFGGEKVSGHPLGPQKMRVGKSTAAFQNFVHEVLGLSHQWCLPIQL